MNDAIRLFARLTDLMRRQARRANDIILPNKRQYSNAKGDYADRRLQADLDPLISIHIIWDSATRAIARFNDVLADTACSL